MASSASRDPTGLFNSASSSSSSSDPSSLPSAYFELPSTSSTMDTFNFGRPGRGLGDYVRRMRHWAQMDWELTMWQMKIIEYDCPQKKKIDFIVPPLTLLCIIEAKNQWARDDPGFVVLLVLLLVMAVIAWCIAFRVYSQIFSMIFYVVVVDFLILSVVVATITWFASNHFMAQTGSSVGQGRGDSASTGNPSSFFVHQHVEWLYAFDVHCNSFFPAFLILHVLQFLLLPIILHTPWFISTLIANSIYFFAFAYYHYITCLGFTALPFLHNTHWFLLPIAVLVFGFVLSLLFQYNFTSLFLQFYFPPSYGPPPPFGYTPPIPSSF